MANEQPKSAYLVNLSGTAELKLVEAVAAAMPSGQVRRLHQQQRAHYSKLQLRMIRLRVLVVPREIVVLYIPSISL